MDKIRQIRAAFCFLCGITIVIVVLSGVVERAIARGSRVNGGVNEIRFTHEF
jgi:hypothetical protein